MIRNEELLEKEYNKVCFYSYGHDWHKVSDERIIDFNVSLSGILYKCSKCKLEGIVSFIPCLDGVLYIKKDKPYLCNTKSHPKYIKLWDDFYLEGNLLLNRDKIHESTDPPLGKDSLGCEWIISSKNEPIFIPYSYFKYVEG